MDDFGAANSDLCKAIAEMIKKPCCVKIHYSESSLEALMSCRLIPSDKNPGLRPNRCRQVFA